MNGGPPRTCCRPPWRAPGKSIGTCESWNYDNSGCAIGLDTGSLADYGLDVRDGQRLDVVVTASRFADPAWVIFEGHGAGS